MTCLSASSDPRMQIGPSGGLLLENVEHCGGELIQDIMSLMSEATHQVKHPPTCMHIHLLFTEGLNMYLLFVNCVEMKTCYAHIHKHNA